MRWEDIPGWFDFASIYYEQIQRARSGARFVEVGCYLGRSSCYMASKIRDSGKRIEFYCVDTWTGSPPDRYNGEAIRRAVEENGGSIRRLFDENVRGCGLESWITPIEMPSVQAAAMFEDESLDFVFIDADHSPQAVYDDLNAWWPKLRPGGLLAGHDYDGEGVQGATKRFCNERSVACYGDGAHTPHGYRSFGIPKPRTEPVRILLAIPSYDGLYGGELLQRAYTCPYSGPGSVVVLCQRSSALANNFNSMWVCALNDPSITHFAMVHADVTPPRFWLDILMHEMDATGAQFVSTIIAIKDHFGVTSTGIGNPRDRWRPFRRYTMSEVMEMPATWGIRDTGYDGYDLLCNTGCWLADMRDPRWRIRDESGALVCYFTLRDRIIEVDGRFYVNGEPEDFFFSRQLQSVGLTPVVTRKVQVRHTGTSEYPNEGAWGRWKSDEATEPFWKDGAVAPV